MPLVRWLGVWTLALLPWWLSAADTAAIHFELREAPTSASLRCVQVAGGSVWAGGTDGAVLRRDRAGRPWKACPVPPGADKLDFRGLWAWDAQHAIVMSSGPGDRSRLFRTDDGCRTWQAGPVNQDAAGFWDAIAFSGNDGVILGDPVGGRFVILYSHDQGWTWSRDESPALAALAAGEGAFAASNSALSLLPGPAFGLVWFGTGSPSGPRLFRRQGDSEWKGEPVPMAAGASSGVFSVTFRTQTIGVAVGGNYEQPSVAQGTATASTDGGRTWLPSSHPPSGYRSAVNWVPALSAWLAVGTNGSDLSIDDGRTWTRIDGGEWNALCFPWCVGPHGRVAEIIYK